MSQPNSPVTKVNVTDTEPGEKINPHENEGVRSKYTGKDTDNGTTEGVKFSNNQDSERFTATTEQGRHTKSEQLNETHSGQSKHQIDTSNDALTSVITTEHQGETKDTNLYDKAGVVHSDSQNSTPEGEPRKNSPNETKSVEKPSNKVTDTKTSKATSDSQNSTPESEPKRHSRNETKSVDNPSGKVTSKKTRSDTTKNNKTESSDRFFEIDTVRTSYTSSDTTGGKSSTTPRSLHRKTNKKTKDSLKSSQKSKKSILKMEEPKPSRQPFGFMSTLMNDGTINRQPTRSSNDSAVVSLPALNTHTEINKVYVEDTEKLANQFPKRDKDFKLEFVYDIRQKYPSWYSPEKKMSRREKKAFKNINGVYADYKGIDDRDHWNAKKKEDRIKQVEKLKKEEAKEKRSKKIETTLEQYEQLKEVREKFEILCWYRNQTQYITPRILEHERLSRHIYGLPESLEAQAKHVKNLRRKNRKRHRHTNDRVKSQ